MIREVELIGYIPDFLKEYLDIQRLMESQQGEIQRLADETERLLNNQFILSADEDGIAVFEKKLGIQQLDDDSLDNRRFRVLSRYNQYIPYSKIMLRKKLSMLCGRDGYDMAIQGDVLRVRVAIKSKRNYEEVKKLLEMITPYSMLINLGLIYNQYSTVGRYTHRQLAVLTHTNIRNEVLPDVNSDNEL